MIDTDSKTVIIQYKLEPVNASDSFEKLAEQFHKETGYMAPGKDTSAAGYTSEQHERNRHEWPREMRAKNA
jgi:hypothetical protein